MSPYTAQEWLSVANKRAIDAEAICKNDPNSVGSVYMIGYAIECSLKALLQKKGIPFPLSGSRGHNLKNLWGDSGYRLSDIRDNNGTKTFFLEKWDTSYRYETSLRVSLGLEIKELMEGAKQLNGWIQTQVSRAKRA